MANGTQERSAPVLVATDLSEAADEALRRASRYASAAGAELVVLHVVPYAPAMHPLFPQQYQQEAVNLVALEREVAETLADRVERVTGRDPASVRLNVAFGDPHGTIVRRAEADAAGMLVIASRGAGSSNAKLGTVAERVVRYAHCPVLTVRATEGSGTILAATDLSDPAVPAVRAAAEYARLTGMRLTLMHDLYFGRSLVSGLGPLGPVPPEPTQEAVEATRQAALEVLRGLLDRFGASGACEATVARDPAIAIIEMAAELDADLIVVGTRGRTGLARIALGSVAESVIRDAHCSVLAVRLGPAE